jgi:hypothetical protein
LLLRAKMLLAEATMRDAEQDNSSDDVAHVVAAWGQAGTAFQRPADPARQAGVSGGKDEN